MIDVLYLILLIYAASIVLNLAYLLGILITAKVCGLPIHRLSFFAYRIVRWHWKDTEIDIGIIPSGTHIHFWKSEDNDQGDIDRLTITQVIAISVICCTMQLLVYYGIKREFNLKDLPFELTTNWKNIWDGAWSPIQLGAHRIAEFAPSISRDFLNAMSVLLGYQIAVNIFPTTGSITGFPLLKILSSCFLNRTIGIIELIQFLFVVVLSIAWLFAIAAAIFMLIKNDM